MQNSSRKKSTRLSKEVRTNEILSSARAVFEEAGYEGAKMADIAKKANVVEGTVFHYFGSKKELMLKVIEKFYLDITEGLIAGLESVSGTQSRLHFTIRYHLTVFERNAALCAVMILNSRGVEATFNQALHDVNRKYTNSLVYIIRDGIACGDINPNTSPTLVRSIVYGTLEHILWDYIQDNKPLEAESTAKALCELMYKGIKVSPTNTDNKEVQTLMNKLNQLL